MNLADPKVQQKMFTEEDKFYRRVFDGVNKNLPHQTTLLGVNGFGGAFRFSNGSRIEFVPHFEKDRRNELVKSNTRYHILEFCEMIGVEQTDFVKEKLEELMKKV